MKSLKQNITNLYKGDNQISLINQRYLPRWAVIIIDVLLLVISFILVILIFKNTPIKFHNTITLGQQVLAIIGVNTLFFYIYKTFSGIIRHSTFTDVLKIFFASISTFFAVWVFNETYQFIFKHKIFLTTSLIIYGFISFTLLLFFRVVVKETYQYFKNITANVNKTKVVIIGLNEKTIPVATAIASTPNLPYLLMGFITKNKDSSRLKILGKPIFVIKNNLNETLSKIQIEGVIIIEDAFSIKLKKDIIEQCIALNLKVFNVPGTKQFSGDIDLKALIKPIQIEDLLEREEIKIDNSIIKKDLKNKVVLVTGGAGSIGSEIVKQIADFKPHLVVILDQSESALYELELFLQKEFPKLNFIIELADVSNMYRLELLFKKYNFQLVYHAAAYKHVPLIERNPHEAIYVNLLGTVNLSVLAVKYEIEKFVMVSTDKAVNPTNVMGASKRAAEMYVQALQNEKGVYTRFITTRFGNVLGSSGSVIPFFKKQIEEGGPVTVTHKDIIRYFMTIPEACQLVLQAGTMGQGGEIFVFDMGQPIKIVDLAEKMIRLSGLQPYEDIDIQFTGLRPGEKLYEELLNDTSQTLPTPHPKILVAKDKTGNFIEIKAKVKEIIKASTKHKDEKVVKLLKEFVPEYKSENSIFKNLD